MSQTTRYDRQIRYSKFGESGQDNLSHSKIMVMGAGALGSHLADTLVRMGIGELIIIDMDIVELSNLHRQTLYDEDDAAQMLPKVEALARKLNQINSDVHIHTYYQEITSANIETLIETHQPDLVLDGMDHFKIRYLINEVCHKYQIPWVYGAAVGGKGTVYAIDYDGPCLKCILDKIPESGESCAINGVLPPVIQQVSSLQVTEAIRYLTGAGFSKQLITIDIFNMKHRSMNIDRLKNAQCEVCQQGHYEQLNHQQQQRIEEVCGGVYVLRLPSYIFDYIHELGGDMKKDTTFAKLMMFKDYQLTVFKDGRINVYGLEDDDEAEELNRTLQKVIR